MKTYQHTQTASTILAVAGALTVVFTGVTIFFRPFLFGTLCLAAGVWIFRSLTIEVSDTELRWHFGPGFPRKRVPLNEVASAEAVHTSFWNGWGIHYTPRGWLYNVSGYGAVAI